MKVKNARERKITCFMCINERAVEQEDTKRERQRERGRGCALNDCKDVTLKIGKR